MIYKEKLFPFSFYTCSLINLYLLFSFFSKRQLTKGLEIQNGKIGLQEAIPELAIKDLVRGSFLGGGSINNPEKKYHLEIKFSQEESKRKVL